MSTANRITNLAPFIPKDAQILVLGSMPSVKSLADGFYYAHPRNRMFKLIAHFLSLKEGRVIESLPTIEDRKEALCKLKIAMYDVVCACSREGSLDSNIHDVEYSDIVKILKTYPSIKTVVTAGSFAKEHFKRSTLKREEVKSGEVKFEYYALPSTSPANTMAFDKLLKAYDNVFLKALNLTKM